MRFRIEALPETLFADAFTLDDDALAARGARRLRVAECPGAPCRVSLADIPVGRPAILIHYQHQPADTPFRASHAIYVAEGARQAVPDPGEVPDVLRRRLISARAFDEAHMMIDADAVEGRELAPVLEHMLDDPAVAYMHLHYARPGCFAASVWRA